MQTLIVLIDNSTFKNNAIKLKYYLNNIYVLKGKLNN